jgi:hypothetical protein
LTAEEVPEADVEEEGQGGEAVVAVGAEVKGACLVGKHVWHDAWIYASEKRQAPMDGMARRLCAGAVCEKKEEGFFAYCDLFWRRKGAIWRFGYFHWPCRKSK